MRVRFMLFAPMLAACAPETPPRAAIEPIVARVETAPGVSLYVEQFGDGPHVVIAPGRLFMANEFRALAAPDRTLILYDMRNRGASSRVEDGAALTILEDVRDLEALRRHFGAARVSLIGYSYLGLMTALYAAEHPDRVERMVQVGPVPRQFSTEFPDGERAGADSLSDAGRAAAEAWIAARDAATPEADQRALCETQWTFFDYWLLGDETKRDQLPDVCQYENEWPANADRHLGFHFADIQRRNFPVEQFTALTLPVLTFHGTLDRNAPYGAGREWARTFPDGRLVTVQGGAHQVWIDDPAIVADIDAFLRGEWPARAELIR